MGPLCKRLPARNDSAQVDDQTVVRASYYDFPVRSPDIDELAKNYARAHRRNLRTLDYQGTPEKKEGFRNVELRSISAVLSTKYTKRSESDENS